MTGILPRLVTLSLCIFPSALFALGLGDIRLKSALNEPLDAEIELVAAQPDELTSLRASLASRETFTRYGLDRPQFLQGIEFKVGRSEDGRNVLFVRSRDSVADPFLTFLVEVAWSRGRLLREYTLLVDPPVYMPGSEQQAAAPVAAPQAGEGTTSRSGAVDRPAEAAPGPSQVAPSVSSPGTAMATQGSYTVRRNDTLYGIARGMRPGSAAEVNRQMIALYRANPEAFRNNMNELRAGAILRQPAEGEFDSITSGDALAEVRRQYSDWRSSRGASAGAGSEEARLRLVTPAEGGEGTAATAGSAAAAQENRNLRDRVNQLESELQESRRALEVRNAELARLQQQLGQQQAAPPAEAEPAPAVPPTAEPTTPTETPTEQPPVAAEPEPTAPVAQEPPKPEPTAAPEKEPGIIDWVKDNWYIPAGALLILIAIIVGVMRRRRQEPDYTALGRMAAADAPSRPPRTEREGVTSPVRAPKAKDQGAFLVEESGERTQLRPSRTAEMPRVEIPRTEPKPARSADETLSSETAINLDQGDPLAEADFHMAYGLYDQAADLVRIATEREPQRRDLKLKLLEIFFVWGNKDSFLQTARELHSTAGEAVPGEWDKIVIMGRQIAPEDPMFSQAAPSSGAGGEVDLNLEGGENRVDLDLMGAPDADRAGGAIDLDVGEDQAAVTGEQPALEMEGGLDFPLEDAPEPNDRSATTREMTARTMETPTIEQPGLAGHDSPTVESPALRERGSSTIKEKIDSALFRKDAQSSDQTAELALDDLGLDLDALRQADAETPLEALEQTDHPSDAATMVAGMDEKSRRMMAEANSRARSAEDTIEQAGKSPTGTWVLDDKTLAATVQLPGANTDSASTDRVRALDADTSRRRKLDADSTAEMGGLSEEEMDLDLDRLEKALQSDTARQPRSGSSDEDKFSTDVFTGRDFDSTDIDVDVGAAKRDRDTAPTGTARIPASDALPELEPVTMSEVGTKLDLARAYMDMGDPEGARSILEEVLQEGSATQKQEAQRLIDSLPG